MDIYNLVSFASIFGLLAIAWLISRFIFKNTQKINWHLLGWALGLQFIFALFIFVFPAGVTLFQAINDLAVTVLGAASAGGQFVFGPLAFPPGVQGSIGFILAFQAFPTIIFPEGCSCLGVMRGRRQGFDRRYLCLSFDSLCGRHFL
jgi:CNT family concentrative nucleoside transporter